MSTNSCNCLTHGGLKCCIGDFKCAYCNECLYWKGYEDGSEFCSHKCETIVNNINKKISEMEYIYFELNDRKLKINRENSQDIWIWKETKNPYWKRPALNIDNDGYFVVRIGLKLMRHHRVVFYAHNKDWDIHNSSRLNLIDHKDQNRKNNNPNNLRIATHQQNGWNRKNAKGYCWHKNRKKWQAQIRVNNKDKHLGYFATEEEAHLAYLTAKEKLHPDW